MTPAPIKTRLEYEHYRGLRLEPLIDRRFDVEIGLRVELQREIFGAGHSAEENGRFYRWCWEHNLHVCQETMRPLRHYSAAYISHILTRGAHPEMAHDPRNINILSLEAHNRWENGDRQNMRIYESNLLIIAKLKKEYQGL